MNGYEERSDDGCDRGISGSKGDVALTDLLWGEMKCRGLLSAGTVEVR